MKTNNNLLAPLGVGFLIGVITIGTAVLVWKRDEPHAHCHGIREEVTRAIR